MSRGNPLYRWLDRPWVYRLSQSVLAPRAKTRLTRAIREILQRLPAGRDYLDVGCGPSSSLRGVGLSPVGLDILASYGASYRREGGRAVTGSSADLPFRDGVFDGVWTFGLLHHLPDDTARRTVRDMLRVCRAGGAVVLFDAVLPEPAWRRPLSWAIRRLDRGRHMRRQAALEALLAERERWTCERLCYSPAGHEGLFCIHVKP